MKRLFLLLLFLPLFFSCGKSSEGGGSDATTYTLKNGLSPAKEGVKVDFTIYECNSKGEKIANHKITDMGYGTSSTFTASAQAEKLKIYFKAYGNTVNYYYWVQQIFYLSKGKNTSITITNSTVTAETEP